MRRIALALGVLGLLVAGCGKYGPPRREPEERTRPQAPAPSEATPSGERIPPQGEFREDPDPGSDEETR